MSKELPDSTLSPDDPNSAIRVYIADLTGIPACRAFAENLEQLHGAEAEPVRNLNEDTTSTPRNAHITFRLWRSPSCCVSRAQYQTADANEKGIREVLDGSGHTNDMGVDGDHVGMVDGDSASGDEDLTSVDDTNIRRKNDWDYEVMPFNAAYDGSLRAVDEAKEIWTDVDLARSKGKEKERERQ
ncbi:hypothetical protein K443DRAFT_11200 [Laccaria amethystina LaAM-08-1]|uniref:Uncharacterized protein n=1 Tax=Laccaria amethystina LaAM-08-1 TaxID=1095629 RepID=A0A0C9XHR2_9AGAR|nr:hypothetical protein K443DRAFT_11200 [Laccaria amethystina LaAM-08-1]